MHSWMVILCVIEGTQFEDCGGGLGAPCCAQRESKPLTAGLRRLQLFCAGAVDPRAMVVFDPQRIALGDLLRTFWEAHDPSQGMRQGNDVGVSGLPGADFLVVRIGRETAAVAGCSGMDTREPPEQSLGTPETAQAEYDLLHSSAD